MYIELVAGIGVGRNLGQVKLTSVRGGEGGESAEWTPMMDINFFGADTRLVLRSHEQLTEFFGAVEAVKEALNLLGWQTNLIEQAEKLEVK